MKFPWQSKSSATLISPREGYDVWAASYAVESNPIKNLSDVWIKKLLPDLQNKDVLDVGCGTGHFCELTHTLGAAKITGLDISPRMIEIARANCPYAEIRQSDISHESPGPEQFDVVILALVLGHIEDISQVFTNLSNALKPGGYLILSDFHPFLTLRNAKRTFKDATGRVFEIQHHLHLFQDIIQNLRQNEIILENLEEPFWNASPAIYAMKAKKR